MRPVREGTYEADRVDGSLGYEAFRFAPNDLRRPIITFGVSGRNFQGRSRPPYRPVLHGRVLWNGSKDSATWPLKQAYREINEMEENL